MSTVSPEVLALPIQERAALAKQEAFKKAVEEHVCQGLPMYVWRDGKVVAGRYLPKSCSISPETIYLLGINVF
jgi:hypothetical protein